MGQTLFPRHCWARGGFLLFSPHGLLPSQRQDKEAVLFWGCQSTPFLQPSVVSLSLQGADSSHGNG